MKMSKALRANRDLPQIESIALAAATAGATYEHAIVALPNLAQGAPVGFSGFLPQNAISLRWVALIFEATLTGVATNNAIYNINQYRGGNLLVNTTSATTLAIGQNVITPASMANIFVNSKLVLAGGTGGMETVVVQAASGGTFTVTCTGTHSGAYTIVSAPLATITFAAGVNATKWIPVQLTCNPGNTILGGDVVTIQLAANGTGLATPAMTIIVEWESSGPQ